NSWGTYHNISVGGTTTSSPAIVTSVTPSMCHPPPGPPPAVPAAFNSGHPDGVNFLMGDGSVQNCSRTVDVNTVLNPALTGQGGEVWSGFCDEICLLHPHYSGGGGRGERCRSRPSNGDPQGTRTHHPLPRLLPGWQDPRFRQQGGRGHSLGRDHEESTLHADGTQRHGHCCRVRSRRHGTRLG